MKRHANLLCLGAAVALLNACAPAVNAPEPVFPIPEKKQVDWQKMETYAFVHFGLNTFNDREWGYGDSDPATFNPVKLDCEQWVKTFVAAGMKGVILTAKHHDGFCLWPTGLTEYCIRNTPYKDGKGDIVRDLSEACKKYGIKFAVYLSPWDRHQANYGTPEYVDYFYRQLYELLTNYGPVFEIWFDGANGGDGWYGGAKDSRTIDRKTYYDYARAYEMIDKFQPQAVVFSDGGPGCRWVGNENGFAGATNWSFLRAGEVYPGYPKYRELQYGHADGNQWTAAECDVSIRPGWFYHPEEDDRVKTVEQLTDLYYRSVGHNATLLLNFPVNRDGLIHPTDSANAVDFYKNVQKQLANNLLKGVLPIVSNERGGKYTAKAVTDGEYDTYWATEDSVTIHRLRRQPARCDVREHPALLLLQHRQILHRRPRHPHDHRRDQLTERLPDDGAYVCARPGPSGVRPHHGLFHRRPADSHLRGGYRLPSGCTGQHHGAHLQDLRPGLQELRQPERLGAGECLCHPRGQELRPRGL